MGSDLEAALDASYQAVLCADYDALAALAPQLETAARLARKPELVALMAKAERNAACMAAASRGIKAAMRRISDLRDVSRGLVTYDESGRRNQQMSEQNHSRRF